MNIKNIATGMVAPNNVNITDVFNIGCKILDDMIGKSPCLYSFRRSMQAIPIPSKIDNSKNLPLQISPGLIFQRLLSAYASTEGDLEVAFTYELFHYPSSLFNDHGFMREASKHELGNEINTEYLLFDVQPNFEEIEFVLDGGLLLYSVPWKKGSRYNDIINDYCNYVKGVRKHISIIFDGYLDSNTKDHTHHRRNPLSSFRVDIAVDMKLDCSKEIFLSNNENKQQFIELLGNELVLQGFNVHYSKNDADTLIVDYAFNILTSKNVCVICS